MKKKILSVLLALALCLSLFPAALAAEDHVCAEGEWEDHCCDECWEPLSGLCSDGETEDHLCDICWAPLRDLCADADGDEWCDVCWNHMAEYCVDTDKDHNCDVCWMRLSECVDAGHDHLCDTCGTVLWVDANADGVCDGCEAVLTHVTTRYTKVRYYKNGDATLVDVAVEVTVESYNEEGGKPAGTVAVRWSDENGNSYSTDEKALTFGATSAVVEYPSLPVEALNHGTVTFTPYDAGFTPAENGCVAEYDMPTLWVDSDSPYTVNGVSEYKLYLLPGTAVTVVLEPGLTESWEWVFEEGCAVPEMTIDGLTTIFRMPEEDVNMHAAWRCEVCTDADGDNWCDVCEYYVEPCPTEQYTDISADAWYHDAVDYVLEKDLMDGVSEDSFAPQAAATRADFLCALWRMEGEPVVNYLMLYSDVNQEESYAEAVRWASAMRIAQGYPDGTFRPEEAISRQEMAAFLYRYAQNKGGGFTGMWMFLLDCTDRADVAEWAYEPLCWLTMKGVVNGDGTGALKPQATATRAEMAQIIKNYMELDG